ncbi:hypothetical protein HME9302_01958 [Alteripontixanthobacter maritimus]|uniref:DAGKc domain-containing protein n=1 Tax=Alteripontixanthobacter maritimus TaxID=2161824 RepID=A0A369Q8E1_9SPHN|nr:diacylglycerol kinase family protein [Alteripontixanthobacter maritimus]RDC60742.1 hypothetical protein HME9302_01958 [Alteripontixanthobacter maritimus]
MKLELVYNRHAGSFREDRLAALQAALTERGFAVRTHRTRLEGMELPADSELVCVHGGDGTLRDTVAAMGPLVERAALAIAPSGTINLVARELGYHRKPQLLAAQLAQGWERGRSSWLASPLFHWGKVPMVSCLSMGPDSHAVAGVSAKLKGSIGRYAYLVALARQMARWPRHATRVSGELADGTPFETEAEAVIVSRGSLYAGSFRLSAKAHLATETFELITLARSTRRSTAALIGATVARLPIEKLGLAEIRTVHSARIGECEAPVQVDGDTVFTPGGDACDTTIAASGLTLRYCI